MGAETGSLLLIIVSPLPPSTMPGTQEGLRVYLLTDWIWE